MKSRMKFLVLFFAPAFSIIILSFFNIRLVTEVKGNVEQAIWVSCTFALYYIVLICWKSKLSSLPLILVALIFSILFLPVRQNIAIVNYVQTETDLYWLERSYLANTLKVFTSSNNIFLTPQQLYLATETVRHAYIELDEQGQLFLVYSEDLSNTEYTRQKL